MSLVLGAEQAVSCHWQTVWSDHVSTWVFFFFSFFFLIEAKFNKTPAAYVSLGFLPRPPWDSTSAP